MHERIKNTGGIEVLIAVASVVFGLLIGPVLEKITSPLLDTPTSALLAGIFFLAVLSISSIISTGIFARRHEKDMANLNTELVAINRFTELGNTAHSLGISGITADWTELMQFKGPLGEHFKERVQTVEAPATWYLVTMSPEAFVPWISYQLRPAVEQRGINVKWVYHSPKSMKSDGALKAQWEWLNAQYPDWRDRAGQKGIEHLNNQKKHLERNARESTLQIQAMDEAQRKRAGSWELYESRVPHFYLAFLSVPWPYREPNALPRQAPKGTFGFVHLYPMFPQSYQARGALCFEMAGDMLNHYYWSTVSLFGEGVERGYLSRTWPEDRPTVQAETTADE